MAFDSECKPVILCVTWPHAYTSKFSFRTVRRPFFLTLINIQSFWWNFQVTIVWREKKINNIVKEINALISLRYLQLQLDYLKIIFRYVFDSLLRHTEMYLVHFCNVHLKILFHILLTEINIPSISIHKHPKMCWSNLIPNKKFASLVK